MRGNASFRGECPALWNVRSQNSSLILQQRSRKMSKKSFLVQRPPSFAAFIMSPKALKLVHFCRNHLDEVVPKERDANWKKTQKTSWLICCMTPWNFLIWRYPQIMDKKHPELNARSYVLSFTGPLDLYHLLLLPRATQLLHAKLWRTPLANRQNDTRCAAVHAPPVDFMSQ